MSPDVRDSCFCSFNECNYRVLQGIHALDVHTWFKAREREFFIDNLLVRIHFIIVMIRWTGLAPWDFELFSRWPYIYLPRGSREREDHFHLLGVSELVAEIEGIVQVG